MKLLLRFVLFPFAVLYDLVTKVRNFLYNYGIKKTHSFSTPIINVGNLTVGGTGKTPHVEYLIRLLKSQFQLSTLSRGYKRKTNGFLQAHNRITAHELGDEPMQFYSKFHTEIDVFVGERRVPAIQKITALSKKTDIILLDDAFQHRPVKPHINILLSNFHEPFYDDFLLPAGRLRECRKGAKRADAVIVSKCPQNLSTEKQQSISQKVKQYTNKNTPIFFSSIDYQQPQICFKNSQHIDFSNNVCLFAGLANITPLENYVAKTFNLCHVLTFPDHYDYKPSDIKSIINVFDTISQQSKSLLTTEKDFVKLQHPDLKQLISSLPVFYLPIEVVFLSSSQDFDTWLFSKLHTL